MAQSLLCFLKVCSEATQLYERRTLVSVFTNQNKYKEDSQFKGESLYHANVGLPKREAAYGKLSERRGYLPMYIWTLIYAHI